MIASVKNFFHLLFTQGQEYLWIGVLMVSAIIVLIGIIKPKTFDKIKNQTIRSIALSLASIAMCFAGTAITFWTKGISFQYFVISAMVVSVFMVLTYWAYAQLGFKKLIHWIGAKALGKFFGILSSAKDIEEFKAQISYLPTEIKSATKKAKDTTTDKELKNL